MIQVNFFEKEKRNVLPYIVGGLFFLILLLMGAYFFLSRMHYENVIQEKNEWLSGNADEVVLSTQLRQMDRRNSESIQVQEAISENQYPMDTIAAGIVSVIPDEAIQVTSFQLLEPGQMTLILENTQTTVAQTIVEDLETLPFVTSVQFLHAETQNPEENQLRFELLIDIDESTIIEEEAE